MCFASDKEDLARVLIKRQLEAERLHKVLGNKRDKVQDTLVELRNRLQENHSRLSAMQQKVELLAEEDTIAPGDGWNAPDITVREEDVEVAFLREKQKRNRS